MYLRAPGSHVISRRTDSWAAPESPRYPIQNILIAARSCDLLALNKFWTRPSVAVHKDLRASDKIQENMRVPDVCVRSETRCEWARRAELQARRCGYDAGY